MISLSLFYCCKQVFTKRYMDDWEKFNEILLTEKKRFLYSPKHERHYLCRLRTRKKSL